jgi:hypothetical protein
MIEFVPGTTLEGDLKEKVAKYFVEPFNHAKWIVTVVSDDEDKVEFVFTSKKKATHQVAVSISKKPAWDFIRYFSDEPIVPNPDKDIVEMLRRSEERFKT